MGVMRKLNEPRYLVYKTQPEADRGSWSLHNLFRAWNLFSCVFARPVVVIAEGVAQDSWRSAQGVILRVGWPGCFDKGFLLFKFRNIGVSSSSHILHVTLPGFWLQQLLPKHVADSF